MHTIKVTQAINRNMINMTDRRGKILVLPKARVHPQKTLTFIDFLLNMGYEKVIIHGYHDLKERKTVLKKPNRNLHLYTLFDSENTLLEKGLVDKQQRFKPLFVQFDKGVNKVVKISEDYEGEAFIDAENVQPEEIYLITDIQLANDTFEESDEGDRSLYAYLEDSDGVEVKTRVSKTNAKTISKVLGDDTDNWIGHYMVVVDNKFYKRFKKYGIIWRGQKK